MTECCSLNPTNPNRNAFLGGNLLLNGGGLADNHVLTLRAGADVANGDADELLNELNVGASLLGEIVLQMCC